MSMDFKVMTEAQKDAICLFATDYWADCAVFEKMKRSKKKAAEDLKSIGIDYNDGSDVGDAYNKLVEYEVGLCSEFESGYNHKYGTKAIIINGQNYFDDNSMGMYTPAYSHADLIIEISEIINQ